MRQLTGHEVNEANQLLEITVTDEPGAGGANHNYVIKRSDRALVGCFPLVIPFQNGPIKENGVNGITHEALLEIVIDRLKSFQAGPYACHENQRALNNLELAQEALMTRTRARKARNVEGTSQV